MLVLRILFLFTFLHTSVFTFASTITFEKIHLYQNEIIDTGNYENNKTFINLIELKAEVVTQPSYKIVREVFFTSDLAKVAITNVKIFGCSFQYLKNNPSICLKLASHLISFQFHAFP